MEAIVATDTLTIWGEFPLVIVNVGTLKIARKCVACESGGRYGERSWW